MGRPALAVAVLLIRNGLEIKDYPWPLVTVASSISVLGDSATRYKHIYYGYQYWIIRINYTQILLCISNAIPSVLPKRLSLVVSFPSLGEEEVCACSHSLIVVSRTFIWWVTVWGHSPLIPCCIYKKDQNPHLLCRFQASNSEHLLPSPVWSRKICSTRFM